MAEAIEGIPAVTPFVVPDEVEIWAWDERIEAIRDELDAIEDPMERIARAIKEIELKPIEIILTERGTV